MTEEQTAEEAGLRFTEWLDRRVTADGRGDEVNMSEFDARGRFWLGRLAPEFSVLANPIGARGERLDPCAVGIRVRPAGPAPWRFRVRASMCGWTQGDDGLFRKSAAATVEIPVCADGDNVTAGEDELRAALDSVGLPHHHAVIRVEVEPWHPSTELVVTLLNCSPDPGVNHPPDRHLYETSLEILDLNSQPFLLESLPDSFRYDRRIDAIGINAGVQAAPGSIRTTDTVVVDRMRPSFGDESRTPFLQFEALALDPIAPLERLLEEAKSWTAEAWNLDSLESDTGPWTSEMRAEARRAADLSRAELDRLEEGIQILRSNPDINRAFRLANAAMAHSSRGRYDGWRPFQVAFLVSALKSLTDDADAAQADIIWFATGGGKTETYLGLVVTAVLHDRIRGKHDGVSVWSRFPLRMLSLQQTQRFADALAGAELLRQEAGLPGSPIRLGFYVGNSQTPNAIPLEPGQNEPDSLDPAMPSRYQVLLRCPFCQSSDVSMGFNRKSWTLEHRCGNEQCPWKEEGLPFHVVDQEIYRFLPAVVLGTLDKAALVGMQAAMRGLFGPPAGKCSRAGHGFTYARRSKSPEGCLVPGCRDGRREPLVQSPELWGPSLRLQDELHLLRDSLGAVDSHYEGLLDHLQLANGGRRPKVVASSATLTGVERQVDVLYQRDSRVFPQPGPTAYSSFWSSMSEQRARRFVAIAPRGVTTEYVSDRIVAVLQESVRRLLTEPEVVCGQAGIDLRWTAHLLSVYGVNVVYGTTVKDVEAARRSVDSLAVNAQTLTGATPFEDVRATLDRLENPEPEFDQRLHVIAASSMLSHGVDIDRLNIMVMLGLPLTTAEFIQATARVGRRWPGLVYVIHRIAREREMANYLQFGPFVQQGDRFVDPVAVTRRSRRVLAVTTPGIVEARRLSVHEPASRQSLTTVPWLRDYYAAAGISADSEFGEICAALGINEDADEKLRDDLRLWLSNYFTVLNDPATTVRWPSELSPSGSVMRSLRDVEEQAPVTGDD